MNSPLFRVRDALRTGPQSLAELARATGLDSDSTALALAHWRQRGKIRRIFALGTAAHGGSTCASACAACRGCAAGAAAPSRDESRYLWLDQDQT
ncbi:hypothetical protein [Acidithiobacillus sp.]|uniref:hypothetical protein n=1 Tax=Acidithiobacillus sp. TaxID=1872118 RepID=UPI0025BCD536|nr:hypothetical protein [Acidithiobacillus sp.]